MKRFLLIIITALTVAIAAPAQNIKQKFTVEKPDLEAIKKAVNDRNSPYYYPRLMKEYQRNDTLMKLDKFRHLYFGYMFQEDYNPYRPVAFKGHIPDPADNPDLTRSECDSVIAMCERALDDNPFDLERMMRLISALKMKGKNNLANIWQYKLDYILMSIVSTGTGQDEENAWYVVAPQHEYVLLNAMGLQAVNHVFYTPYYEFIQVKDPRKRGTEGYYFNIKTILEEYYRKYPEEK